MKKILKFASIAATAFSLLSCEKTPEGSNNNSGSGNNKPGTTDEPTLTEDIEFELEETQGNPWQVISYNADLCRVKVEHDADGIWPLRHYKAEIEIDAVSPGETDIVFADPTGKKVVVKLTVK